MRSLHHFLRLCLSWNSPCLLCLKNIQKGLLCLDCEETLPFLDEHEQNPRVLFAYQSPVEQFMILFKYKQNLYFANWFAEKMILRWKRPEVDCIIPVPLHPHRQKERGFNQTLEIAKIVAAHWSIPLDRWSCKRVQYRFPQSSLSASRRKNNVKASSFRISSTFKHSRVLVIEDVITTGTTFNAFKEALQKAGVKEIVMWACCQRFKNKDNKHQIDGSWQTKKSWADESGEES